MKCPSLASAACGLGACAVMTTLGCGSALFHLGDGSDDDAGGTNDGGALESGVVPPPNGDASTNDAAPPDETCKQLGATRACADATRVQACLPRDDGGSALGVWSKCVPTACGGASPLPAGTQAACVSAGTFTMGGLGADGGNAENDTMPAHAVTLTRRYYFDQYEVSVGELNTWWNNGAPAKPTMGALIFVAGSGDVLRWTAAEDAAVAAPGAGLNCTGGSNKPLASINCITRATALAYCMSVGGRLPTEAEWEYAASGQGKGNAYPWGNNAPTQVEEKSCLLTIDSACVNALSTPDQFPFLRPSAIDGNTNPSLGSLNNLAGNMAEWTLDNAPAGAESCATGACWPAGATDPWAAADTGKAVTRGGSFQSKADQVRTQARAFDAPNAPQAPAAVGFRCVHTD